MISNIPPILEEEARLHFERMISACRISGIDRSILDLLFDRWVSKESGLPAKELAKLLAIKHSNPRAIVAGLRKKLSNYNGAASADLCFNILTGSGYSLEVTRHQFSAGSSVQFFPRRGAPGDPFDEIVCGQCEDVLITTIGSTVAFYEYIEPWFRTGKIQARRFRILTWLPGSAAVIEALASTVGQNKLNLKVNTKQAWKNWKNLERQYPQVEVYSYDVIPTALCALNDHMIKVEFLPFNVAKAEERPAIAMKSNETGYDHFRQWFDDLWFTAMRISLNDTKLDAAARRPREERLAELRKRGYLRGAQRHQT